MSSLLAPILLATAFALPRAEFAIYHERITGVRPAPDAVTFAVDPAVSAKGNDAYTIRSTPAGAAIVGSNTRSVWYGLYDLLERRGGCHWFWDGDVVPKKTAIDLTKLDVREEARFAYRGIRYFAHRGLTRFQAEHWGPEDWRREIDWCLKRRLNVFMLRIGQDDLFVRTFPEVCRDPDPSKPLPGRGKGYDDRSLFWPNRFRGDLRASLQGYARARGLMVPEDFGTMTHWYSRTPEDYLAQKNPPFLPQSTRTYSERNGRVWDIREDRWVDEYWKLTQTAVKEYGGGTNELLHTIGLGERNCGTNRADNLRLKIATLMKFVGRAHRDYPNSKVLLAGWDFYFTWFPDEVKSLLKYLDPKRDIIWDYEGDATRDFRPEMLGLGNNFTKWGVIGAFPYTYSIFLAYEDALDMRANYPLIEKRQKLVQDDPMCRGYVLWPESSHTDTLLLRYFTANAWSKKAVPSTTVLDEFCASRYGRRVARLRPVWRRALAVSRLLDWNGNYAKYAVRRGRFRPEPGAPKADAEFWAQQAARHLPAVDAFRPIVSGLLSVDWEGDFVRRDTVDLARIAADRRIIAENAELMDLFFRWKAGADCGDELLRSAERYVRLGDAMARLLALHTDYSLWESYRRLCAVEPVRNPDFPQILLENALCGYCASHQYEAAEYWYKPVMHDTAGKIRAAVKSGNRSVSAPSNTFYEETCRRTLGRRLETMRPTLPRTSENYRAVLAELLEAVR